MSYFQTFSAVIQKVGINPCVDVPEQVSKAFTRRGYVPVKGQLNGHPIRATLVPVGGGRHRLYINTEMRKAAGVGVGDLVFLKLALDPESRDLTVPPELAAKAVFEKFPPSHKKEILEYLNSLKRVEYRKKNIAKLILKLELKSGRKASGL